MCFMAPKVYSSALRACLVAFLCHGMARPGFAQDETPLRVPIADGVTLELVRIAPGEFQQGSPADEPGRGADEGQRPVTITREFFLGKFPVTRGQFAQFIKESGYRTEAEQGTSGGFGFDGAALVQRREFTWKNPGFSQTDDHPVTIVTYPDAEAFCAWLTRKSRRAFSLPSEAQWEYACRAGSTTAYPNGIDAAALEAIAWYKGNAGNGTRPAGQKSPNPWGLSDMLGNVWEWCADWYAPYPPGGAADPMQTNSQLSDKPRRVLRGGSWMKDAAACRSAARYRNDPRSRNADNGFRVKTFVAAAALAATPASRLSVAPALEAEVEREPTAETPRTTHQRIDAPRTRTQGIGLTGVLLLGILFVVIVFIAALIVRALRRVAARGVLGTSAGLTGSSSSRGPLRTRVTDDGFWIESSALSEGATLRCRYLVEGQQQEREVAWHGAPGGEFVFTGARPANVSVTVAPGSAPDEGAFRNIIPGDSLSEQTDQTRRKPFRGHPPAY